MQNPVWPLCGLSCPDNIEPGNATGFSLMSSEISCFCLVSIPCTVQLCNGSASWRRMTRMTSQDSGSSDEAVNVWAAAAPAVSGYCPTMEEIARAQGA